MSEHDRSRNRRRFLALAGTSTLFGLAGCSSIGGDGQEVTTATETTTATTTTTTATETTETTTTEETTTETTEEEGPGYKKNHWHGRLFFEINGERLNFRQPKYYLDNLQQEHPETVYFHFHKPGHHGPNEWSNEKKIVTFQRALNLLPDISYEQKAGAHVVSYKDETFDAGQSGTTVSIHRGTEPIDPTTYEVQHDDNFWVQAITEDRKRDVSPAHGGAGLGTLVFDINNLRLDFSQPRYLASNTDNERFHFHDDGYPGLWYTHEAVTVAEALNSLPGIGYSKSSGGPVITYQNENHPAYSQKYDGSGESQILLRQRATDIDPTSYELQTGDIIWVYVHSTEAPDNEH
jgi:hypothetical protein